MGIVVFLNGLADLPQPDSTVDRITINYLYESINVFAESNGPVAMARRDQKKCDALHANQ